MVQFDQDTWLTVIGALDIGIIVLDRDRRVAKWNDWMAAASGIAPHMAMGKRLEDLYLDASLLQLQSAIDAAFESGTSRLVTHSLHAALLPLKTRAGGPRCGGPGGRFTAIQSVPG
ncbi:MAG: PAS domain-containing protein [Stellaceae bacterium]